MRHPLKWEFPGGKLEAGESPASCIIREIAEELNLVIEVRAEGPTVYHAYRPDEELALIPLVCEFKSGGIMLREHAQVQWLTADELPQLSWAAADVAVVKWWQENWQRWT